MCVCVCVFFLSLSLLFPMHSCWQADSHNSILLFRLDVWAETVNQVVMCVHVCVCAVCVRVCVGVGEGGEVGW